MSAENAELVAALQPEPDVNLVELFRDDQAWAKLSNYGLAGFRQTWLEWLGPWESYRADIDRVIDCGDDVLVITNDYGRKPGMTAEVRLLGAAVWTVRDGRIAKAYFYADRQDALDALGVDAAILARE